MKKEGYIVLGSILGLNLSIVLLFLASPDTYDYFALDPLDATFWFFTRLFALLGLVALFVSSILTPFAKELYQIYKKPFIKIHHGSAIFGLVAITLHPIIFAIDKAISESNFVEGLKVFLPKFDTAYNFWSLAGRPALILIYVALIGALLRKAFKSGWRYMHALNYVALIFGVVHGIIIGEDFYNFYETLQVNDLIVTILFLIMTAITIATFTLKRIQLYKLNQRKKERIAAKEESVSNNGE